MKAKNICAEITERKEKIKLIDKELFDIKDHMKGAKRFSSEVGDLIYNSDYDNLRYFVSNILHDRDLRKVLLSYMHKYLDDKERRLIENKKKLENELKELGEKEWTSVGSTGTSK